MAYLPCMTAVQILPYKPIPPRAPSHRKVSNAIHESRKLQQLIMTAAQDKDAKGVSLASLARAWMDLERLKRDIKMLPKPRPVDVVPKVRAKLRSNFVDPQDRPRSTSAQRSAESQPNDQAAPEKPLASGLKSSSTSQKEKEQKETPEKNTVSEAKPETTDQPEPTDAKANES